MDYIYQLQKHVTKFYPMGNDWDWGKHKYKSYNEDFERLVNSIKIETILDMKTLIKEFSIKSHDLKKAIKEAHRNKTPAPIMDYLNLKYVLRHLFLAYADLRNVPRDTVEIKPRIYSDTILTYMLKRKGIPDEMNDSIKHGINEAFVKELNCNLIKETTDVN